MGEILGAVGVGLLVGIVSALTGIGGGVIMVPFLYIIYSGSAHTLTAQTVVAHATSLGVALVSASIGTWRYHNSRAINWRAGLTYAFPAIVTAFVTARVMSGLEEGAWIRGAFGLMLIVAAADMVRLGFTHDEDRAVVPPPVKPPLKLAAIGVFGGMFSSALGIGGGLLAIPSLFYIGRLPVREIAPTSLMTVLLTTMSGVLGYVTASGAPPISGAMAGFVDLRMAVPLALGAVLTVPLGVHLNRASRPVTLYWIFAVVLAVMGVRFAWKGFGP
ncbi:MAG: sulfite exporter TauE/SafE family protein [Gemmatimonadales bacterium]